MNSKGEEEMSEIETMRIRIEDLVVDPSIEIRSEERSKEVIEVLSEAREELPPIVVDQNNRVIDGIHRLEAHKLNGDEEVDAEVIVAADDISAIMIALRRNSTHGVTLSGKSRRANAIRLFDAGKTIPEIGKALGVSNRSVDRYLDAEKARIKEKQQRDVVYLCQTGMEMQDIADAISGEGIRTITRSTVSRYVGDYLRKEIADRLEEGWDIDGIEKSLKDEGFAAYLKNNPNLLQEVVDSHDSGEQDPDNGTEPRKPSEGFGSPSDDPTSDDSDKSSTGNHRETVGRVLPRESSTPKPPGMGSPLPPTVRGTGLDSENETMPARTEKPRHGLTSTGDVVPPSSPVRLRDLQDNIFEVDEDELGFSMPADPITAFAISDTDVWHLYTGKDPVSFIYADDANWERVGVVFPMSHWHTDA